MKILVTGVAGFIGSKIARALLAEGHEVTGVDAFTDYYDIAIKKDNVDGLIAMGLDLKHGDLNELQLETLVDGVQAIFHQAGQPGVRPSWGSSFDGYVVNNVLATQRLLESVRGSDALEKFVYASSSSIYGDAMTLPTREEAVPAPRSPYGVTKLAAEHLCGVYASNFGVPAISLRYFTVFGPGQRPDMAFTRFCRSAVTGETISVYGDGEQTRDFTYVDDVVRANVAALQSAYEPGQVVNIAGGTHASVNEVLRQLSDLAGRTLTVEYKDVATGDVRTTSGDTERAQRVLGWTPSVNLEEGLSEQFQWATEVFGR